MMYSVRCQSCQISPIHHTLGICDRAYILQNTSYIGDWWQDWHLTEYIIHWWYLTGLESYRIHWTVWICDRTGILQKPSYIWDIWQDWHLTEYIVQWGFVTVLESSEYIIHWQCMMYSEDASPVKNSHWTMYSVRCPSCQISPMYDIFCKMPVRSQILNVQCIL